ncbi:MAG: hypothetical protein WCD89_21795 [Anaerocolumna sp.]
MPNPSTKKATTYNYYQYENVYPPKDTRAAARVQAPKTPVPPARPSIPMRMKAPAKPPVPGPGPAKDIPPKDAWGYKWWLDYDKYLSRILK